MAGPRDNPEEIVRKLQQGEGLQGEGMGISEAVPQIGAEGAKTGFIAPSSLWENGYCEGFNAQFRGARLTV